MHDLLVAAAFLGMLLMPSLFALHTGSRGELQP